MRNLLTLLELTTSDIERIFEVSARLRGQFEQGQRPPLLAGRVIALLFEKPSLRTRVSFEAGMAQLGGHSLFLGQDVGWRSRESVTDFAGVLSSYVDAIVCRAKSHDSVEELARHSSCPVINGLTDRWHPCQALADLFTLRDVHGTLSGRKLAFVGDSNNVARSLAVACGKLGVRFAIASPPQYTFDAEFVERLRRDVPGVDLLMTDDPREAVEGADGVYTDVWASMGQENEQAKRRRALARYRVDSQLLSHAPQSACFLHCLPARRGEEVTDEVIDGPQSAVLRQAANRMHVQKGLLALLLGAADV